jgi:hypothetical protein
VAEAQHVRDLQVQQGVDHRENLLHKVKQLAQYLQTVLALHLS